jgi:hypothetical protein
MFDWFSTSRSEAFARELAGHFLQDLRSSTGKTEAKFSVRAGKLLGRLDARVREFAAAEKMNVYKRAKLANAFLWTLKDGGCPEDYAQQATEWLTFRL